MGLIIRPVETSLLWQVFFKEPQLELSREENRLSLITKLLKSFDLRLNDLKFNQLTPSNNFIHFFKLYGQTFLDVSFGLEEISAILRAPQNEEQVLDLLNRLFQVIKERPVSEQKFSIRMQCATEGGNITTFFQTLSRPVGPRRFRGVLRGKGFIYDLTFPEYGLIISVVIANSLVVDGGLYLHIEYLFSPNQYDFENAFGIITNRLDFITKGLNIQLKLET